MGLDEVPLVLILAGVALYTVLGGADFGAGFWYLLGRRRGDEEKLREQTFHAMAPVWEANHVWLIFVLAVLWTAYPVAFGSIASTLAVPLFIAAIGVILRGATYALRSAGPAPAQDRVIGVVFSLSSILTPFALGTAAGAIASGRVPVGNAEGDLFSSWLNGTALSIGVLAVTTSAYMAAVFLAADAARQGEARMRDSFRVRALAAGLVAGAIAVAGLVVLSQDAPDLFDGLTEGFGLVALIASVVAGLVTLSLVATSRFEPARYTAAVAVAAIVAGWGFAQSPELLPGLTVDQAAAPSSTIVTMLVGLGVGALILVPSLVFLFRLVLGGRFDAAASPPSGPERRARVRPLLPVPMPLAIAAIGAIVLVLSTAGWLQLVAVSVMLTGLVLAVPTLTVSDHGARPDPDRGGRASAPRD